MKDEEKNKPPYDGSRIRMTLAHLEEQAMWDRIHKFRLENPWVAKLTLKDKVVGKAIFTSTVDIEDQNLDFKSIWDDSKKT